MTISQLFSFREKLTKNAYKIWKINNFLYAVQLLYHILYPIRNQLLKMWGKEDITIFLSCIVVKLYYQTAESHKPLQK